MMYHTGIFWLDLSMDAGMLLTIIIAIIQGVRERNRETGLRLFISLRQNNKEGDDTDARSKES